MSETSRLLSPVSRPFVFTLKVWPAIAAATIGICCLTALVAGWLGIELKEQANVELVRQTFVRAFESWKLFGVVALNATLILVIMPVIEEFVFRWGLFNGCCRLVSRRARGSRPTAVGAYALVSSALFSAAHYLQQPWPDNAFLALFFFGLAQCWLYRKTRRLWCAMLNHALFNLTNLVLLLVLPQP